jgi:hypothetical protein
MKACCLHNFSFSGFPLLYNPNNPHNDIEYRCCVFCWCACEGFAGNDRARYVIALRFCFPLPKVFFLKKGSFLYFPSPPPSLENHIEKEHHPSAMWCYIPVRYTLDRR